MCAISETSGLRAFDVMHQYFLVSDFDENNVSLASMASFTIRSFMDNFVNQPTIGKVENGLGPHNHYDNNFQKVEKQNHANLNGNVHSSHDQGKTGGFKYTILEDGMKSNPLDPRTNGLLSNIPAKSDNRDTLDGNSVDNGKTGTKPSEERAESRDTTDVSSNQSGAVKGQNGTNQSAGDVPVDFYLENSDFVTSL